MTFGFKNHEFSQEVENTLVGGSKEQQEQMPLFGTQWGEKRRKGSLRRRGFPLTLFVFSWGDKGRHHMRFSPCIKRLGVGGSSKIFWEASRKNFQISLLQGKMILFVKGETLSREPRKNFFRLTATATCYQGRKGLGKGTNSSRSLLTRGVCSWRKCMKFTGLPAYGAGGQVWFLMGELALSAAAGAVGNHCGG